MLCLCKSESLYVYLMLYMVSFATFLCWTTSAMVALKDVYVLQIFLHMLLV